MSPPLSGPKNMSKKEVRGKKRTTRLYVPEDTAVHIRVSIIMERIRSSQDCRQPATLFTIGVRLLTLYSRLYVPLKRHSDSWNQTKELIKP
jgi:hypothetical protein